MEQSNLTCDAENQIGTVSKQFKATFALTLNPPIERELFGTVLEAVVSGDVKETVQAALVSCKVKDENVAKENGRKPNVTIYRPDDIKADSVSLVCKVTSSNLGNVYIMWKVGDESYKEGRTSAPIHQNDSTSILSILTIPKKTYENPKTTVTCAVKHANMDKIGSPLQVTTSQSKNTECPIDYSEKS
ncbi:hypothetical protein DPX16_0119 [Anabarilius grahami]|uniref:Ig-like domain-containing protein n=1 Tax=Anabarilius grahami TaxID=495550 RepID=A0A3N0YF01_ANAGA|nr:hypothetical protein DPX16_0119 [Anabarilius grahami]